MVRHFGLKLVEDVIKIKWNNMTPEQKLYVKESAMTIMEKGIQDIIKEPNHIKDAIARIIVEVQKCFSYLPIGILKCNLEIIV